MINYEVFFSGRKLNSKGLPTLCVAALPGNFKLTRDLFCQGLTIYIIFTLRANCKTSAKYPVYHLPSIASDINVFFQFKRNFERRPYNLLQ